MFIDFITSNELGNILTNVSLKEYTTIKIGGLSRCIYYPTNMTSFCKAYKYIIEKSIPFFIIGKGSNLLISDDFHDKVFISFNQINEVLYFDCGKVVKVYASSGAILNKVIFDLASKGLSGMEKLTLIPGSIGGAIYMNAGCNDSSISECLDSVDYLDEFGEYHLLTNFDDFDYRKSFFTNKKYVILGATFNVYRSKINICLNKYHFYKKKKLSIQPYNVCSAGCIFKNPGMTKAYELIETSALSNTSINNAKVSSKHHNFIINDKDASFNDVLLLISLLQIDVYLRYRIWLTPEIIIVK